MAGGRGNPGGIPLAQRVRTDGPVGHSTVNTPTHHRPGPDIRTYGETATYRPIPDGGRHVLVHLGDRPQPGLLTEWRKPDQLPWEGHCWFPQLVGSRWVLADRWILASAIEPV